MTNKKPLISIILPVYNGEKYLSSAIESLLQQTYDNWELIIVNDNSTDSSQAIAEKYIAKDRRIKLVINKVNKRLPASLNIGFNNAKGELFTWTSDDNLYYPNALEKMLDILNSKYCDLVYADYRIINENSCHIADSQLKEPKYIPHCGCGACFLYKRDIHYKLGGYREEMFLAEDYDFFLRASSKYKAYHLKKNLYEYRSHDRSLTVTKQKMIWEKTLIVIENNWDGLSIEAKKNLIPRLISLPYCLDDLQKMRQCFWISIKLSVYKAIKELSLGRIIFLFFGIRLRNK